MRQDSRVERPSEAVVKGMAPPLHHVPPRVASKLSHRPLAPSSPLLHACCSKPKGSRGPRGHRQACSKPTRAHLPLAPLPLSDAFPRTPSDPHAGASSFSRVSPFGPTTCSPNPSSDPTSTFELFFYPSRPALQEPLQLPSPAPKMITTDREKLQTDLAYRVAFDRDFIEFTEVCFFP